jgi:hypothetical protein
MAALSVPRRALGKRLATKGPCTMKLLGSIGQSEFEVSPIVAAVSFSLTKMTTSILRKRAPKA